MTNTDKYEMILAELALGKKQSEITLSCKCSYGTITRAKAWEKNKVFSPFGKKMKEVISPKKSSSSENSSSIIFSSKSSSSEILEFDYNSRFLSWMGSVLKIDKYYGLSKEVLKSKIIEKISKL